MPDETGTEKSALDLYYIDREGMNFKATVFFEPYFYIDIKDHRRMTEIGAHLRKKFDGLKIEQIDLEDLDLPNHLSGKKHRFLKLSFGTERELLDAKTALRPIIQVIHH
jgi:DNA polymerase epsilon subunit 1